MIDHCGQWFMTKNEHTLMENAITPYDKNNDGKFLTYPCQKDEKSKPTVVAPIERDVKVR